MTKELLVKFLNNNCTDPELNEVIQWLETEALSQEGISLVLEDWNNYKERFNSTSDKKFTILFDKIQEQIYINTQKQAVSKSKTLSLHQFTKWLTNAAAILLLPVLVFLSHTLSEKKTVFDKYADFVVDSLEVIAPIGSWTIVQLSDGSEVHLNYGSKIKYPQFFTGDTREILLEGEGFFEIAHNPEKPFIVRTRKLNIKALGTSFNVSSYPSDNLIFTTLVSGKVVLEENVSYGRTKNIGSMKPGQHVGYDVNTGEVSCIEVDTEKYIAWKDGKLVFVDTPIVEVAEKLSRMFNVDIEVTDDIKSYIYTVTFMDEPLYQILDLMTIATPVSYEILQRKRNQDGTYSKQKIIIKKKN